MGNVGVAQDLENVAKAVSLIRTPKPFLVHIVGIGPDLENLKKTVVQLGVEDHFRFHGRHPLDKMPDFYRLADACLLTLYADTAAGLTIPGKLQGYMSAGKPVIAAIGGGAAPGDCPVRLRSVRPAGQAGGAGSHHDPIHGAVQPGGADGQAGQGIL